MAHCVTPRHCHYTAGVGVEGTLRNRALFWSRCVSSPVRCPVSACNKGGSACSQPAQDKRIPYPATQLGPPHLFGYNVDQPLLREQGGVSCGGSVKRREVGGPFPIPAQYGPARPRSAPPVHRAVRRESPRWQGTEARPRRGLSARRRRRGRLSSRSFGSIGSIGSIGSTVPRWRKVRLSPLRSRNSRRVPCIGGSIVLCCTGGIDTASAHWSTAGCGVAEPWLVDRAVTPPPRQALRPPSPLHAAATPP